MVPSVHIWLYPDLKRIIYKLVPRNAIQRKAWIIIKQSEFVLLLLPSLVLPPLINLLDYTTVHFSIT